MWRCDFSCVKAEANDLFRETGFLCGINTETDDEQALELIEEYDKYVPLIDMLSASHEFLDGYISCCFPE